MEIINTTAPIAIEELKKYFVNKETFFVIDYENSDLKGQKLLTYLGNLDLPIDIVNFDLNLVQDYFLSTNLVSIPSLEEIAISILFEFKKISETNDYQEFIETNNEILELWKSKLDSLTLYNLYTIQTSDFQNYVESFPKNNTNDLKGINFISLLKNESFFEWFKIIDEDTLSFYETYFNDYMFKGKNLYTYWANENNPMFLLTRGIASGDVIGKDYFEAKTKSIEELKDVTLV